MIYADIREQIQSGDVIAFSHTGLASWSDFESQLVRIFTRSEYTHVAIAWSIGGRVLIIEAVVPQVRIYPLSHYKEFYWLPIRRELSDDSIEVALSIVGQKYSKIEAIKSIFIDPDNSNSVWQCAEVVKKILHSNGIELKSKATPSNIVNDLMTDFNIEILKVRI